MGGDHPRFDYDAYIALFNSGDDAALIEHWFADDCVMESSGGLRRGKPAMREFLGWAHDGVRECPRVQHYLQDGRTVFAEIDMDFHATKARPDFPFGALLPGDSVTVKFLARYDIDDDGKVAWLKTMTWPPGQGVTHLPKLGPHPSQLAAYDAYTAAFSAGDPARYSLFYTEDVELALPSVPPIRGRDGIAAFYSAMFRTVRESLTVHGVEASETQIVADTTSRFTAVADAPDFVVGPLAQGEWIDVRVIVTYHLRDGLVERIAVQRAGEPVFGRG
ncbi:DUF4440 domain-containing protein [Altererythrobacter xixiisoli]|uniref:DUF4440 domain-containing protein n=1 Tax=Croceibacterium xixiisoli TaxID=1476466 RepID=A0A6I4TSR1_9SPHN|nr:nuclear transport factor 2 family protein [Croceibacterium xixiisoli]MXO99185.1 DUF4440 domain-containing protein [Croceibacterium xixiisoli]